MTSDYIIYIFALFLIGSIFGYFYEYTFFDITICDRNIKTITGKCLPMLTSYGTGVVMLSLINSKLDDYSLLSKTLLGTIIVTIAECFMGIASSTIYDKKTWDYSNLFASSCYGFISLPISIIWFGMILIFNYIEPHFKRMILF